jgi:hypothetical protein
VRLSSIDQLSDTLDPPFREKDLDKDVEEFTTRADMMRE